jgi:pimeloyl-ACP methyl ester carboxylesterase
MEIIEVAGLPIAFERAGNGAPLVLLHGIPGDRRLWRRQIDDLADEYTVIAWDAPGCGRSSAPREDFGIRDVARYLVAFIQALRLEKPHGLGLSWGGGDALELYRAAPAIPSGADALSAPLTAALCVRCQSSGQSVGSGGRPVASACDNARR